MGGVLSYSGLSTKIRAMQSRLTTMDQFEEILQLSDVTQVAAYLKRMPEYSSRWDALDENTLHRGQIEKLLKKSIFQNFSRIYHFANPEQRKFLAVSAGNLFQIFTFKQLLTDVPDLGKIVQIQCHTIVEEKCCFMLLDLRKRDVKFVSFEAGDQFLHGGTGSDPVYINIGMQTEKFTVRRNIYRIRVAVIEDICHDFLQYTDFISLGIQIQKFDMLNLQFIQRSKRYYNMDPASIYALLIPVNYKLKKEEITALVEAPSYEEGRRIFQKTWYGNKYEQLTAANLEEFYNHIHRSILEKESHRNPYSVAVIYSYLYNKEHEVNRLTIAIECVRYGVQHDEAMRYICNS